MSSKAVSQHQQGRRTPLSLTGKHVQPQHQNNKNNANSTKNQEAKSETNATKNGNNNAAKNSETANQTQKEVKKIQQNVSNGGEQVVKKSTGNGEDVNIELNGKSNGHNNKKNLDATKPESNKEKEIKETGTTKEKSKKNETNKLKNEITVEKKQNEEAEKPTAQVAPTSTNSTKSKDDTTTTTSSTRTTTTATVKENKKQSPVSSAKSDAIANTNDQKNATETKDKTEKGTATPPPSKSQPNKKATPSKSPKDQIKNTPELAEIPDDEMLPLVIEKSPAKKTKTISPTATSTPGKISDKRASQAKTEPRQLNQDKSSGSPTERKSVPRSFSQISGRRSIRPIDDFTPSMYNSQFRESYRRINTELDVTSNTNTSMNVTVGSEIPNNSSFLSFSLFGRGRKRERTPPLQSVAKSQSAVELTTETTPPKRARLDVQGIFTAMSSPLTLLRSRFSKTTLESSTPTKVKNPTSTPTTTNNAEDDVQNVSGVSIDEEVVVSSSSNCNIDLTATVGGDNITIGMEAIEKNTLIKSTPNKENVDNDERGETDKSKTADDMDIDGDIKITETSIIAAVGDPKLKQRGGCTLM